MPAVLQGGLPTVSGFGKLSAVEAHVVEQELAAVVAALPGPVVLHCCAPRAPLDLFRAAGAAARSSTWASSRISTPWAAPSRRVHLVPGVVPDDADLPAAKATASRVHAWWRELGFPAEQLPDAVTLDPVLRPRGATPGYARTAMAHVREAAKYLLPD